MAFRIFDSVFFFKIEKDKAVVILIKKGTVGGYNWKLSPKSPCNKAKTERWKPQPGQSKFVKYLIGQGIKKISALPKNKDKADMI